LKPGLLRRERICESMFDDVRGGDEGDRRL
jgi:hypothetical protein